MHRLYKAHYLGFGILIISSLISACGFQLRQAYKIPPQYQQVVINSENANTLKQLLSQALIQRQIIVVDPHSKIIPTKTLSIKLSYEKRSEQVIAIRNKEAKAYEISLQVGLSLGDNKTIEMMRVSQKLNTNQQQIISSINEENRLHKDLNQKMVEKILFKLSHAK